MRHSRHIWTAAAIAALAAGTGACGSDDGGGANVANYSEAPIGMNDVQADMAGENSAGNEADGVQNGAMAGDIGYSGTGNYTNGHSASGNDAEPVEKKKR
jgi:hypothetical protein